MANRRMKSAQSLISVLSGVDRHWRYRVESNPHNDGKKRLKLKGKELLSVPLQIFKLEELSVLDLSPERESCLSYKIDLLPREVGQLKNLTTLNLDTNDLKEVPAEIGALQNLERLTLSNNLLRFLPPEFGQLKKLQSLHLANNRLEELPAQVCQLGNLTFLDISDNKIRLIPHSIQDLEKLETLLLFFNLVEALPESFCSLRRLSTLWLGRNRLKSLPRNFGDLVNLEWGYNQCSSNFEGNPLETPPPEVCNGGPEEIKYYFAWWESSRMH
ncbi:uncharacterized protein LOC102354453 [Latimeria chalumnae]|nr:PREDICTED: plant intracellular Ras-group-related LRR protein 7-like [Latimeria chalumnae]|eukprot:XP_006005050.1 PREDICTED: plant intracellular Ras-group-related LRR protein 7-like [Latimeria chalumnae]